MPALTLRPPRLTRLIRDRCGVAMIEFAYALPFFTALALAGIEMTNYVTTKMRVSQLALHLADHTSRIGSGSSLAAKKIDESQINDALIGAGLQAGGLNIYTQGRVIISSLEVVAGSKPVKYRIAWQRCRGVNTYASTYGNYGATNLDGIGPVGRQVIAPTDGATMFVQVRYRYTPILLARLAPSVEMDEIASMMVRDRRDLSQVHPSTGVIASTC